MSNILELITKKIEREDNAQALLGTEIKLRRNALSKTLEEVSQDTCSVSYLSKVENAEIKPNPVLLEDICRRVKLTSKSYLVIKQSKQIFEQCIKAIYFNDEKKINELTEMVFDLKNYRAKMVRLIYALRTNNLRVAKRILGELKKIEGSMQLNDLFILAYLESWYDYQEKNFQDSFMIAKSLLSFVSDYKYLDCLCLEILVDILLTVNSPIFLEFFSRLKVKYLENNSFDKMIALEEKKLTYYYANSLIRVVKEELSRLDDNSRINYLVAIAERKNVNTKNENLSFEEMVYLYFMENSKFKSYYSDGSFVASPDERLILDIYYAGLCDKQFSIRLQTEFYPKALSTKNYFIINYTATLLIKNLRKECRYKKCLSVYDDLQEFEKERKKLC